MKKLFLSVMLVAFAVAVNAGETKDSPKACCAKQASTEAKAQCPMAGKQAKGQCPASAKQTVAKISSPKASEQAKN